MDEQLARAMWAGDVDELQRLAPCDCCCGDHTWPTCPARLWGGCRSGLPYGYGPEDEQRYIESWRAHYEKHHGMTAEEFYGIDRET